MASLTIRNLDDSIKALLSIRAAHHGYSMEEEARQILRAALLEKTQPSQNLAKSIQKRFAELGGIDQIPTTPREPMREPPQFTP
ncbi:MAG: hypothetical protein QNJ55_19185 [Xenococcus sp. MO_188.B8]|nr:hypothetical protein [Xenococcus sp. MO_188.B8]